MKPPRRVVLRLICLPGVTATSRAATMSVVSNTDADLGLGDVSITLANTANGTPPPPGLTIQPFRTMAERTKEENAKKQSAGP